MCDLIITIVLIWGVLQVKGSVLLEVEQTFLLI